MLHLIRKACLSLAAAAVLAAMVLVTTALPADAATGNCVTTATKYRTTNTGAGTTSMTFVTTVSYRK
jgi:hypothetical protein